MSSNINVTRANVTNVTVTTLNFSSVNGANIASNTDIKLGTNNTKIVTPYGVKVALSLFSTLGNSSTVATFTTITAADFGGSVIANSTAAIAGTSGNTIITPATLLAVLQSPAKIGAITPNNAIFTSVKFSTIAGNVVATTNDLLTANTNNKVIAPMGIYNFMQTPSAIGGSTPNTAVFTNVTAGTINLGSNVIQVRSGGTSFTSYGRGDLLIASGSTTLTKLPAGSDGYYLIADSTQTNGVNWIAPPVPSSTSETITTASNTEALNNTISNKCLVPSNIPTIMATPYALGATSLPTATFTTLTASSTLSLTNPVGAPSGGLGLTSYNKGDIIVGTSGNSLTTLSVLGDNKYLIADSTATNGVKWSSVTQFNPSGSFPYGYLDMGTVNKVTNGWSSYSMAYLYARDTNNDANISLNSSQSFNLYTSQYNSGAIAGTVKAFGYHLIGSGTSFTTTLTVGQYINVGVASGTSSASYKVVNILSDTDILLNKPCAQVNGTTIMVITTNGCQISTSNAKIGSSSLYVYGGNSITFSNILDRGNMFTIEFWYNISNLGTAFNLLYLSTRNIFITVNTNLTITYNGTNVNTLTSRAIVNKGSWEHFALSCDGSNTYLFINGKLAMNLSKIDWSTDGYFWSYLNLFYNTSFANFYIDELRISNIARYTEEFTPNDQAWVVDPNTIILNHFEGANGLSGAAIPLLDDTQQVSFLQSLNTVNYVFSGSSALTTSAAAFGSASLIPSGGVNFTTNAIIPNSFTSEFFIYPSSTTNYLISTYAYNYTVFGSGSYVSYDSKYAVGWTQPRGLRFDSSYANLYVIDSGAHSVRKINMSTFVTTTIAGANGSGFYDGGRYTSKFNTPIDVVVDSNGNTYVTDSLNYRIRKVTPSGNVTTFIGNGGAADIDGTGINASINKPLYMAVNPLNSNQVYVVTTGGNLRTFNLLTGVISTFVSNFTVGISNMTSFGCCCDPYGNIYIGWNNTNLNMITSSGINTVLTSSVSSAISMGYLNNVIYLNCQQSIYKYDLNVPYMAQITGNNGSQYNAIDGIWTGNNSTVLGGMIPDNAGNLYVSLDSNSSRIVQWNPITMIIKSISGPYDQGTDRCYGDFVHGVGIVSGISCDSSGNIYYCDTTFNKVRKINSSSGVVTTLAGVQHVFTNNPGVPVLGSSNTSATGAVFNNAHQMLFDSSGNFYVNDAGNYSIRKVNSSFATTSLAGSHIYNSWQDGTGTNAYIGSDLNGLALDTSGNLWFASNNNIRMCTPSGVVTSIAGSHGTGNGASASFGTIYNIAFDTSGNLYIVDSSHNQIKVMNYSYSVSVFAGSGSSGHADGTGTGATFNSPYGIAIDSSGNVWVSDTSNNTIRKITPSGVTTTVAGTQGTQGSTNANGLSATFNGPYGIAFDSAGNLWIADGSNGLRKMDTSFNVTTVVNSSNQTLTTNFNNGTASTFDVTVDSSNNVYFNLMNFNFNSSDNNNNYGSNRFTILKWNPSISYLSQYAGNWIAQNNSYTNNISNSNFISGYFNYAAPASVVNNPRDVVPDSNGNLYILDTNNYQIRIVNSSGVVSNFAGSGANGHADGTGAAATFSSLQGGVWYNNVLYVIDNKCIRAITTPGAIVTIFAGSLTGSSGSTNATGTSATFNGPRKITVDGSGNLYVTDYNNNLIRKITQSAVVTTIAGSGSAISTDGTGTSASFNGPSGICCDANNNLYVTDFLSNTIRMVTSSGVTTTIAGNGAMGVYTSTNSTLGNYIWGVGTSVAAFSSPYAITIDLAGNLYVSNTQAARLTSWISKLTAIKTAVINNSTTNNLNLIINNDNTVSVNLFTNLYTTGTISGTGYYCPPALYNSSYKTTATVNTGAWNHIALQYDGIYYSLYLNGTRVLYNSSLDILPISYLTSLNFTSTSPIDEYRLSSSVRYSGTSFTVPAAALSWDSNTLALSHFNGSNGATSTVDESVNNIIYPFTVYGSLQTTNTRYYPYGTANGIVLIPLNAVTGDSFSSVIITVYVQLPWYIDYNVDGNPNKYALVYTGSAQGSGSYYTQNNSGSQAIVKLLTKDANSIPFINNKKIIDLTNTFIDSGSSNNYLVSTILKGTVSISGSTVVTGTGTVFTVNFTTGDYIYVISTQQLLLITAVTDDTHLVISATTPGTTVSGSTYYQKTSNIPSITTTSATGSVNVYKNTVYGISSTFTSDLVVGDQVQISSGGSAYITSITNDSLLTLSNNVALSIPSITWIANNATYSTTRYKFGTTSVQAPTILGSQVSIINIADLSGNNNTVSLAGSGTAPAYAPNAINGLSALYFASYNNGYITVNGPGVLTGGYTISFVMRLVGPTPGNNVCYFVTDGGISTGSVQLWSPYNNNQIRYSVSSNYSGADVNDITNNTNHIITVVDNITSTTIYVDGTLVSTITSYSGTSTRNLTTIDIGGWSSGSNSNTIYGYIGEFQIYNAALSTSNRQNIEYYLAQKWGITGPASSGSIPTNGTAISTSFPTGLYNWYDFSSINSYNMNINQSYSAVATIPTIPNILSEFTIECWVYATIGNVFGYNNPTRGYGYNTTNNSLTVSIGSNGGVNLSKITTYAGNTNTITANSLARVTLNVWHHIAYVQNGYQILLYVDGINVYTVNTLYLSYPEALSTIFFGYNIGGYIDEARVSNTARYGANFTVQSAEFTTDANTLLLKHFNGANGQTSFADLDDFNYDLSNQIISKVVRTNNQLLLRGTLYAAGNCVYGYGSNFRTDINQGDLLYFPSVSNLFTVMNVLTDDTIITSLPVTSKSNINNIKWNTIGNTYLSNLNRRFGGTSLFINGQTNITNSYVSCQSPGLTWFNNSNSWTMEMFFNLVQTPVTTNVLFSSKYSFNVVNTTKYCINIMISTSNQIYMYDTVNTSSSYQIYTSSWNHIAIVASGAYLNLYVNGIYATNIPYIIEPATFANFNLGGHESSSYTSFYGYIDELRISNTARYTPASNFTVPTNRFQMDSNTIILNHFDGPNNSTNLTWSDESSTDYQLVNDYAYNMQVWYNNNKSITGLSGTAYILGNTVYGVGTSFLTQFSVGDNIIIANKSYKISIVQSDTNMLVNNSNNIPLYLTSGTAALSSSYYKFGSNSLYMSDSSAYLNITNLSPVLFNNNYTIEAFVYPTSLSAINTICNVTTPGYGSNLTLQVNTTGTITASLTATTSTAQFSNPNCFAFDSNNNMFIADQLNNCIRKITASGVISILCGSPTGTAGNADGTGITALLNGPWGIICDSSNNIWFTEFNNNTLRQCTPSGVVTTRVTNASGGLTNPCGITIDSSSNLFICNYGQNKITKVLSSSPYTLSTFAGASTSGSSNGTGTAAKFGNPTGITIDVSNNLYVSEAYNADVRKITAGAVVTTLSVSGLSGSTQNNITVDTNGNLFIRANTTILKYVISSSTLTTIITGLSNVQSGSAPIITNNLAVCADANGYLWYANNNSIYRYNISATTTVLYAGNGISGLNNGTVTLFNITSSATITANSWSHVSLGYAANNYFLSVNGTMISTYATLQYNYNGSPNFKLGPTTGYIDELRISNSRRYQTTFTPTTTAFLQDNNTMLLTHFDNTNLTAGPTIVYAPVGNVALSTVQKQFGTSSILFDKTARAYISLSPIVPVPTNWTIEFWVYPTATNNNYNTLLTSKLNGTNYGIEIRNYAGNISMYLSSSSGNYWDIANNSGSSSLSANTWTAIAITYDGTNYRFFTGGVLRSTVTSSIAIYPQAWSNLVLGDNLDYADSYGKFKYQNTSFIGYIDELRISNNTRYTSNYTVASSAFTTDGNTITLNHFDSAIQAGYTLGTSTDVAYGIPNSYNTYSVQHATNNNHLYQYLASTNNYATDVILSVANVSNGGTIVNAGGSYNAKLVQQLPYIMSYSLDGSLYNLQIENKKVKFLSNKPVINIYPGANNWQLVDLSHFVPNHVKAIECEIIPSGYSINTDSKTYISNNSTGFPYRLINNTAVSLAYLEVLLDASVTSSVTASSNNLTAWVDQSTNNQTVALSSTGTSAPTYTATINGLNAMTFGGTGNKFVTVTGPGLITNYVSFIVFQVSTKAANAMLISTDGTYAASGVQVPLDSSGVNLQYNVYNTTASTTANPTVGTTYVLTIVDTISTAVIYLNGTQVLSTTNYSGSANRNFSTIDLGGFSGSTSNTFNGIIGEFRLYSGTMSVNERVSIESSLCSKWGLQCNSTITRVGNMVNVPITNSQIFVKSDDNILDMILHNYSINL